ncbi:MAG: alpha/beta hydrolase [Alphaproteobacteria bacterium]|nr:alpha/beta hydrolase [Alphaproteobacteria bacterium]
MTKPAVHPDMECLAAARAPAGQFGDTIAEQRKAWTHYTNTLNRPPPATMRVWDETVPAPEHAVAVRLYRPAAASESGAPAVLYLHGGGFMKGDLDSSDSVAWGFAEQAGAVVVSVDYRLAPEHPYPAAFNDAWNCLVWLHEQAGRLGLDPARIGVAGDSAGGNLSAALCLKARDRGGPAIACAALIYPGTGLDQDYPSYREFSAGTGLTTAGTRAYRDMYLPGNRDTDDPYARPIMARDFSGLPPFWVHSAQIDPIRDDGREFAARLAQAGVDVSYREAKGMVHGFMRARFLGAAARAEYDRICGFLRERLYAGT